jgi:hypothetical protein
MKCYGQEFKLEGDNFPCPTKAQTWDTVGECIKAYEEFLVECESNGVEPGAFWVYLGEPDGNEDQYGYPDMYDFLLTKREDNSTWAKIL